MDGFIQLMKTPGVSEEIQQEIIYQKNKNIIQNRTDMIWELQQYINIAKEEIFENEVPVDLNTVWDAPEWKKCESIEEHNAFIYECDGFPFFSTILICSIKDIGY